MAFLRFTRDKRGYEHFSLVEATTNRRGKSRSRLLYWYRTPPNIRVGREPFDEAVRRELEAHNPGVQFDWRKIVETPIPSADVEHWRERRRAEKAEKAARRAETVAAAVESEEDRDEELAAATAVEPPAEEEITDLAETDEDDGGAGFQESTGDVEGTPHANVTAESPVADLANPARRRRRRRSRRGRSAPTPSAPATSEPLAEPPEPPANQVEGDTPAPESEGN